MCVFVCVCVCLEGQEQIYLSPNYSRPLLVFGRRLGHESGLHCVRMTRFTYESGHLVRNPAACLYRDKVLSLTALVLTESVVDLFIHSVAYDLFMKPPEQHPSTEIHIDTI